MITRAEFYKDCGFQKSFDAMYSTYWVKEITAIPGDCYGDEVERENALFVVQEGTGSEWVVFGYDMPECQEDFAFMMLERCNWEEWEVDRHRIKYRNQQSTT